jgi:hypothetical protein
MGARTLGATAERRLDVGGRTLGIAVVCDFSGSGLAAIGASQGISRPHRVATRT